jgi:hypothetical protein
MAAFSPEKTPKMCTYGSILTQKKPKCVYMAAFLPPKKIQNVYIWHHFDHQKPRIFSPAAGCVKNVYVIYGTILTQKKNKIFFVCGRLCKKCVYIWHHFDPPKKQNCFRLRLCKKSRVLSKIFRLRRAKTNDGTSTTKHV